MHIDKDQLTEIATRAEVGKLTVTIAESYDLDEISEAHRTLDSGHVAGNPGDDREHAKVLQVVHDGLLARRRPVPAQSGDSWVTIVR